MSGRACSRAARVLAAASLLWLLVAFWPLSAGAAEQLELVRADWDAPMPEAPVPEMNASICLGGMAPEQLTQGIRGVSQTWIPLPDESGSGGSLQLERTAAGTGVPQ
jgi:hypothetical protein